ncbi:MAG: hypothetical protein ACREB3_05950 [Burkholderiales bacterium]
MVAVVRAKFCLDANGEPIAALPAGINGQNLAISGTSAGSAAFDVSVTGRETRVIRIVGSGAFHYRMGSGSAPTAVATDPMLPANVVEYITLLPGQTHIAIIQDAAATGNVNVSEVA